MSGTSSKFYVIGESLPNDWNSLVNRAREFATEAHTGQSRASGEPFIEHPLAVAQILSDLQLDDPTLAAALLHDVVEDTPTTLREIYDHFGPEVASLVDSMTIVDSYDPKCAANPAQVEACYAANLAKLNRAIIADPRVALIRLADRLHNMRTLSALPRARQRRIAWETLTFHVPLACCFGIGDVRDELQWLALAYLDMPWKRSQMSRLMVWSNYITLWNPASRSVPSAEHSLSAEQWRGVT